ncbi:hypothetical protein Pcinc_023994 [Petrolisthes cinctipes]|uniref:Uncharacterized protein n=1 Tax=Petrolisthes cinctipes TaxID=88211 RepID=A0AAE1FDQ7_PETCI|nr:hypothetical protein Pcinc_023994 [Petrolisthes cinctipes]
MAPYLVAPWSPNGGPTAEHQKARATLRKLQGYMGEPDGAATVVEAEASDEEGEDVPDERQQEIARLYEESTKSRRRGNRAKADGLQERIAELQKEIEEERIAEIRALGPDVVDLE